MTDRTVLTRLKADVSDFNRGMLAASAGAKAFTKELDTSTDRSTMLVQSLLAVGPALVPIGAAAVPVISGLTNQLAFAAAGAGVTALALSGVGDALKATNDYAVEPTEANLQKMRQTLSELGPAGREFVAFLQEIRPELQGLQDAAQQGLLPGVQDGIEDLMSRLPQVERIVSTIASSMGDLIAEAGSNLASPRFDDFFDFLENEARPTLVDFGRTLGNFAEGFANLWMAFDPLSDQFSSSFLQMSRDFSAWSAGLDDTEGFQEFIDYIQRVGPKAWETLGALGNALLQIVEAAAPVGEASLPIIEAVADVLATIANSPVGPVLIGAAAGISALSRAMSLYSVANGTALTGMLTSLGGSRAVGRSAAAGVGLVALSMTDLDEKVGLSNAAMGASIGLMAGPWGAAVGGAIGLTRDLAGASDTSAVALEKLKDSLAATSDPGEQEKLLEQATAVGEALRSAGFDKYADGVAEITKQHADAAEAAREQRFEEAGLAGEMDGASQATRDQVDAILTLIDAHNRLADVLLKGRSAQRDYEQAIDDADDAAKKNGKTLDINTQAGRDNQEALDRLAQSWNNLTPAQQSAEGASKRAKSEFIRIATAMTGSRKAAEKLAAKLLDIPSVKPKVTVSGLGKASADVGSLIGQLGNLDGMTATAMVRIGLSGADLGAALGKINAIKNSANGNLFDFYANGGMRENHVAQIAPANTIRVWAEPETGGEAYIPLAASKRDRSVSIWEETGKRLGVLADGVRATRFADGGFAGPSVAATTGSPTAVLRDRRVEITGDGLARLIDSRVDLVYANNSSHDRKNKR